jgi:hypothetical protein
MRPSSAIDHANAVARLRVEIIELRLNLAQTRFTTPLRACRVDIPGHKQREEIAADLQRHYDGRAPNRRRPVYILSIWGAIAGERGADVEILSCPLAGDS